MGNNSKSLVNPVSSTRKSFEDLRANDYRASRTNGGVPLKRQASENRGLPVVAALIASLPCGLAVEAGYSLNHMALTRTLGSSLGSQFSLGLTA